jgi:hypothetical protein
VTLTNSEVVSNIATNGHGGGIVVMPGAILVITGSTLSHNQALGGLDGGAIDNLGNTTISNATLDNNLATETGGGIYNGGALTVTNSSFVQNDGYQGGAIGNYGAMTLTADSLINNSGRFGGALYNTIGLARLVNVTISGNRATKASLGGPGGLGGGIYANYPGGNSVVHLIYSTIAGNSAETSGGGMLVGTNTPNTVTLLNTIVAHNPQGGNCVGPAFPATWTVISNGFNIDDGNSCQLAGTADHPATDPKLAPLGNYGGPTLTLLPLPGSPAIDNGQCLPLGVPTQPAVLTDQRGVTRPQGSACDIGAVERASSDRLHIYLPKLSR